ncbi:MAG: hypothetical protein IRZ05_09830 [Micromonosporaceae bacterium]|jgi:hypothetical protein|nr:hypothetical protein [Micromonosporaceae bacterium]
MSTRSRKSSIDRRTAERLLRDGRGTGDHPLAGLLAAAKAPGRGDELAREEMAVAAFRAARRGSVPLPQRRSMIKTALAKLLTVKAAALAATVVGVGGVALAASTGTIPGTQHSTGPAASHSQAAKAHPSGTPASHPAGRPSRAAVPSGMPPGLYWLCNDYIGRDAEHRGKALGESKFQELAARTGRDRDNADKFCDKLLQQGDKGGAPTAHPTGAAERTANPAPDKPSQAGEPPANRPSGPPSTHPHR